MFVDIDNTISAYGDTKISNEAAAFLRRVRHSGIEPVLLTNNTKKHVEDVLGGRPAGELLTFCLKPLPHKVHRFLKSGASGPVRPPLSAISCIPICFAGEFRACIPFYAADCPRRNARILRSCGPSKMLPTRITKRNTK
nr:hypothetical protein [Allobaculum sp. Allo2]